MIDPELLKLLVCPVDRTPLKPADEALLSEVNRAIRAGTVRNRVGAPVEQPLDAALVREDETLLYPVVDEIPVLLADEAISLDAIRG